MKKEKQILIAITGTPAAGKSTFAKKLSKALKCDTIEINKIAEKTNSFRGKDKYGSRTVLLGALAKNMKKEIGTKNGTTIVVGHLAQELGIRFDYSVVMRAPLKVLLARMRKRKYNSEKIRENLISEALDYCGSKISRISKETYEVSTGDEKKKVVKYLKNLPVSKKKPVIPYVERVTELPSALSAINQK